MERKLNNSKRWVSILLVFVLAVMLTVPLATGFTFSGSAAAPDATLTYTPGRLTWGTETEVLSNGAASLDLFGEDGMVAPGTSVSQMVRLNNYAGSGGLGFGTGTTIRYHAVLYQIKGEALPGTAALSGAEFTKVYDPNNWYLPEGIDKQYVVEAVTGTLEYGDHQDFTVSWDWAYESGADEADTALGVAANSDKITYQVGIYIVVEEGASSGFQETFYSWTKPLPENIAKVDGVEITGIPGSGSKVVSVTMGGETLVKDRDYTLVYNDAGTAIVTLTPEFLIEQPIGIYHGVTIQYPNHNSREVDVWIYPAAESMTWGKDKDIATLSDLVISDGKKGEKFIESVSLNGDLLDKDDYMIVTDENGDYSVVIEKEFLMSYPIGEHTLTLNYKNEDVEGQYTGEPSRNITFSLDAYLDSYTWDKGSKEGLKIEDFIGLKPVESVSINDTPLASKDYTISYNSDGVATIVINPEKLDSFAFGSYVITIGYKDGDSRPANLTLTSGTSDYQWTKGDEKGLIIDDNNPGKVIDGIEINGEPLRSDEFSISDDGQTAIIIPEVMENEPMGDNEITIKYTDGTERDANLELLPWPGEAYEWQKGDDEGLTIEDKGGAKPIKDVILDGKTLEEGEDYTITTDKNGIDTIVIDPEVLEEKPIGDHIITLEYEDGDSRSIPLDIQAEDETYTWQKDSGRDLEIDDSNSGKPIEDVYVDGKRLDDDDYEIVKDKDGDYTIYIDEDYLQDLPMGDHTIKIEYTDGDTREGGLKILPLDGPYEYEKGSKEDLEIKNPEGDNTIKDVYLDDKPLDDDDYSIVVDSNGETKVVIDDKVLEELAPGTHTVELVYRDGTSRISKLVIKGNTAVVTPQTGDSGVNSYMMLAAACAFCAMILVFVPYKKRRKKNET